MLTLNIEIGLTILELERTIKIKARQNQSEYLII